MEYLLSLEEQQRLLAMARNAIEDHICSGKVTVTPCEERRLNLKNGCFVTIKKRGELRGCIGNFQSELPLFKNVAQMAVAAASNDPRFYHLESNELPDISLQISVLSPLEKISSIEEIQVGEHGIYVEKDYHHGVLLPQVATEHNWDRQTFLSQTCLKAGLPPRAWEEEDTDIYTFSAQIFGE
ncbi:MAG: AmmeMemoRadiSam system protein A [Desulfuromonadaceae bacterium]|nr:AmmeMemoRadiSam system protein A [Desulfuromonadaceae bacterium]